MHWAIQIVLIVLPITVLCAATYFLVKSFFDNESKSRMMELRKTNRELITPIRLQSYERVTLFLERISPNSLVMRTYKAGMTGRMLQVELVKAIRNEFEHNMSQQIYMSNQAWELVKTAKEETIKIINIASTKIPDTATGLELSQAVIEIASQLPKLPTQVAIEALKKELSQEF